MLYDPRHEQQTGVILLRAASNVRERGLAKHTQEDTLGRVCLHGAISIAAYGLPHVHGETGQQADRAVCRYLKSQGIIVCDAGAAHWNNADERTAEEVIAALEGAAMAEMAGQR